MRSQYLSIGVISRTTSATKTAPGRNDPTIGHQQSDAVIVPACGDGWQLREGFGGRIPQFGHQNRVVIEERLSYGLSTNDDHLPVRKHDAIAEYSRVGHRTDLAHGHAAIDIDHVTRCCGEHAFVGRCATHLEDLADVVHHGVPGHAVGIV